MHKLEKIKNYIKRIFADNLKRKISNKVEKNLESFTPKYEIGDVVWSFMPFDDETIKNIKKGHRVRPHIIVDIDYENGNYQVLMLTSKKPRGTYAKISVEKDRISYVKLGVIKYLEENKIERLMTKVDSKDAIKIVKRMLIRKGEKVKNIEFVKKYIDQVKVEVGDIISIQDLEYYVYGVSLNKLDLLKVYPEQVIEKTNENSKLYVFKKSYAILLDEIKTVDIYDNEYRYVDILHSDSTSEIQNKRKEYKNNVKNEKKQMNSEYNDSQFMKIKDIDRYNRYSKYDNRSKLVYLTLGDIIEYDGQKYIYLYTDNFNDLDYLLNYEKLCFFDYNGIFTTKSIYAQYKTLGYIPRDVKMELLQLIKLKINQIENENVKEKILNRCLLIEKNKDLLD